MTPAENMRPDSLPGSGPAQSVGETLAAARVASGRNLVDIASETRVPLRHLEALEADEHDALPALPYAQGFVRSFARALNLDAEGLAARFKAETSKQPHVPSVSTLAPLDEKRLPTRGLVVGSLVALVLVVAALSAWGAGAFDAQAPELATSAPSVETPTDVSAPGSDFASDSSANVAAAPVASTAVLPGQVVLEAREDVWVRIYDPQSKVVAMSGVMAPGAQFVVPMAPAGLMLWTGKAGALRVTIGGVAIPPLGGVAQTLRAVSLLPADLQARSAAAAGVVAGEAGLTARASASPAAEAVTGVN